MKYNAHPNPVFWRYMTINKIDLRSELHTFELNTINSIAKYWPNFNDSLLIESRLDLSEIQILDAIFS